MLCSDIHIYDDVQQKLFSLFAEYIQRDGGRRESNSLLNDVIIEWADIHVEREYT